MLSWVVNYGVGLIILPGAGVETIQTKVTAMPQGVCALRKGMKLPFVQQFASEYCTREKTTRDVVEEHVRPECEKSNMPFIDCRTNMTDTETGLPTVFVSHAWGAKFDKLLAGIERYYELNDLDKEKTYLWIDIFIVNQADPPWNADNFEPKQALDHSLSTAGQIVLVLDDATKPHALNRLWPLYEFHYAHHRDMTKDIILEKQQKDRLLESLLDEEAISVYASCANITEERIQNALAASRTDDEDRIRKDIRDNVGFSLFAGQLRTAFHRWFRKSLERWRNDGTVDIWAKSTLALARLIQQFPDSYEDVATALNFYNEVLENHGSITQTLRPHTKYCARANLAKAYEGKGDRQSAFDEWFKLWREATEGETQPSYELMKFDAAINIEQILAFDRQQSWFDLDYIRRKLDRCYSRMQQDRNIHKWVSKLSMHAHLAHGLRSAKSGSEAEARQWIAQAEDLVQNSLQEPDVHIQQAVCEEYMGMAADLVKDNQTALKCLQEQRKLLRKVYTEVSPTIQEVDCSIRHRTSA